MYLPRAFCSSVMVGFWARGNLLRLLRPAAGAEWLVVKRRSNDNVVVTSCVRSSTLPSHGGVTVLAASGVVTGVESCSNRVHTYIQSSQQN